MKQLFFVTLLLSCFTMSYSQGLGPHAEAIKEKYPDEYQKTIRANAVREWGDNYEMIVYEINQESEALFGLANSFKTEHTSVLYKAILEWSTDGQEGANRKAWDSIEALSVANLLKFNCNWGMVKYEYDNQVKAKSSF